MAKNIKNKGKQDNQSLEIDLNRDNKVSQKVDCTGKQPSARFGHTLIMVSNNKIVMFGGAIGDTKNFTFSNETFVLNIMTKIWTKIDINEKFLPCPRAAHASCTFGDSQMLMYGGSTGNGSLAGEELYYFDLKNGEEEATWTILNTTGKGPGKRYGHTLCCIYPYVILFGGNTGSSPSNDVYIISLGSSNTTSFQWNKLELLKDTPSPSPRVYHAASVCTKGNASGMMILFGGRDGADHALNDTWGLRKHRDGSWDWTKAPIQSQVIPKERFNHSISFLYTLMIVTGGRDKNIQETIATDVYDTETSEWRKFPSLGLFRHSSFIKDNNLYVYGGFENRSPNFPVLNLYKLELSIYFSSSNAILGKLALNSQRSNKDTIQISPNIASQGNLTQTNTGVKFNQGIADNQKQGQVQKTNQYNNFGLLNTLLEQVNNQSNLMDNQSKKQTFILSNQAIIIQATEDMDDAITNMRKVDIEKLIQESKRIGPDYIINKVSSKRIYNEDVINKFIDTLLRPFDWANKDLDQLHNNLPFLKEEIDCLLKDVAKIIYKEKSLVKIRSPAKIFGNIFGQYYDLMRFFETYGNPSDVNPMGDININTYIFNGDFCDRGNFSLEVIFLLFALKVKYPDNIVLIRGHHEDENINKKFGLYEECDKRLNDTLLFSKINAIFDILPFGCLIDNKILCVHGGIGSSIKTIQDIENIQRPVSVNQDVKSIEQQIIIDLLYSEFSEDVLTVGSFEERDIMKAGFIVKYGKERVSKFLSENSLSLLVTSHSWIPEGVKAYNSEKVLIVYSSTNHMDKAGNIAGMINITKNCNHAIPKLIDTLKSDRKYYKKSISQLSPLRNK